MVDLWGKFRRTQKGLVFGCSSIGRTLMLIQNGFQFIQGEILCANNRPIFIDINFSTRVSTIIA